MNLTCISKADWIIIISTVLFFMIIQTLFFKYEASIQYQTVIESKLDVARILSKRNVHVEEFIKKLKSDSTMLKEIHDQQQSKRQLHNDTLTLYYCWIPIIITVSILLLILATGNIKWSSSNNMGLFFVFLSYITELIFFFFVVQKYEFVGDEYIISRLFNKITT